MSEDLTYAEGCEDGYREGYNACEVALLANLRERMVALVVQRRGPCDQLNAMQAASEADILVTYITNGAARPAADVSTLNKFSDYASLLLAVEATVKFSVGKKIKSLTYSPEGQVSKLNPFGDGYFGAVAEGE